MKAVTYNINKEPSLRCEIERVSRLFTKQEIASFAGVSKEELCRFERGDSLKKPLMRKLTAAYHLLDATGFRISSPYR
jgi:transcriptional regulator with XRE-family HTH domain